MEDDVAINVTTDNSAETALPPADIPAIIPKKTWRTPLFWVLFAATFLLAAFFRFDGLNWDNYTHLHPDERFLTIVLDRLEPVDSFGDYLSTSRSTLNPHNIYDGDRQLFPSYVYGNFPMTVTRYVAEWANAICQARSDGCELFGRNVNLTRYDGAHFIGRILSALVDLCTLATLCLIGAHLYGRWVGLLSAFLFAVAVQPIQQSHFFTVDNWSVLFSTIAVYCAIRASERNQYRWYAVFGISLGLAVASRINVAPLAILAGIATLIWLSNQLSEWTILLSRRGVDLALQAGVGVVLAALCSMITFRLAQPYAFADIPIAREMIQQARMLEQQTFIPLEAISPNDPVVWLTALFQRAPQWRANIEEIQRLQQPDAVFPPAVQWVNRPAIIFPATNMLFWGMGLAAGLAAFIGCLWALLRIIHQKPQWRVHVIPVSWSLIYFLFIGSRWVKNNRYFLPIYPTLLLLGAWGLLFWWHKSAESRTRRTIATAAIIAIITGSFLWATTYTRIYRQPHTRIAASEWFIDNIPSGATIIYDTGDLRKTIQLPLKNFLFQTNGTPFIHNFEMPEAGHIVGVRFNYLTDEQTSQEPIVWQVSLRADSLKSGQFEERDYRELSIPRTEPLQRDSFEFGLISGPLAAGTIVQLQINMRSGGVVIADTSRVLNEAWDDALPVRINQHDPYGSHFAGVQDAINQFDGSAPVINPDSPDKLNDLVRWLDQADVVVLSSQRAIWSLPRIPLTYPLMIRYYETLFNGELGFELVEQFHADTSIGPLYISDVNGTVSIGRPTIGWPPPRDFFAAEEAFSVYDHPPVWLFVKTDTFSAESAYATLSTADVENVVFMNPGQATDVPNALMLSDATFEQAQANGTFAQLFAPDSLLNRYPVLAAAVWYLFIIGMQLLAFPLLLPVLKHLPSRGYIVARIFALLLLSYFVWITGSVDLLPATSTTGWLGIALLAVACALALLWQHAAIGRFFKQNRAFVFRVELLSLTLFLLSLLIRYNNPDVWHVIWGGEKPMDLSYLTATMKSVSFPPYDPWYAGGALNYYYYGFLFVGIIAEILHITPTIAYNLAIPMLFSFTGMGAFSVAYDLAAWRRDEQGQAETQRSARKGMIAGSMALVLAVLVGNLAQIGTIRAYLSAEFFYPGNWFFSASRAIAVPEGQIAPITEFPFFTFLYADLHAHMIALPLTMLALSWIIGFALRPVTPTSPFAKLPHLLIGGLLIGVLYPTNSWDWPTYIVLAALGSLLFNLRHAATPLITVLGHTAIQTTIITIASYLFFLPFHQTFGAGFTEIALWKETTTSIISYVAVYGLFLFLTLLLLAYESRAACASLSVQQREQANAFALPIALLVGSIAVLVITTQYLGYQVAGVAIPLIFIAFIVALNPKLPANRRVTLGLIAAAYGLTLLVEIFVIEGTVGRMNTVFKFYMQVWMLLSVVGGVAFMIIVTTIGRWRTPLRHILLTTLGILLFIAALYPITATRAKWQIRMSDNAPKTLDGMAFMQTAAYDDVGGSLSLAPDYAAIRWVQRNIAGSPVIAEAYSHNFYRSIGNRVAMYTGNPAIIGWSTHQSQQRAAVPGHDVQKRISDVETLYNTTDVAQALSILDRYDVRYIYVGLLEYAYYTAEGLQKFERMAENHLLSQIYNADGVAIYEVVPSTMKAQLGDTP